MPRGGYQQPTNPAAVSGPGALSTRTDGQQPAMNIPAASYGDASQTQQIQAGAPMAGASPVSTPPSPPGGGGAGPSAQQGPSAPVPLTAGSLMPDQPITHGADSGPGPGSASLGLAPPQTVQYQTALTTVQSVASMPDASPATKALLQALQGGY